MRNTLPAFLVLAFSSLLPAQTTGVFSNQTSSIMNDAIGYFPGNYPSRIEVTGMPVRLHGFAVRFMMLTGSWPDLDILLEAPNGQRILLTSDLPYPFFDSYDFGIGSTGKDTLGPTTINDMKDFYPANYDDGAPDIFPSPGPGIVVQPAYPDPLALQDIDPNGEWKLYIVDDTPNGSSTWLLDGWRLEITAGDLPACKRPGKPVAVTGDYSATLDWTAGAGNTQWDLFVTEDLSIEPADTSTPTHPGLLQNQNVVVDSLEPGLRYATYVRADCGGGRTSPWVGPAVFKTTIHPCDNATPVALCQKVEYPKLPYYKNFFFGGYKTWVFAFTPPDSGDYWMQFEGGGGPVPYYRLDSLNNCEDGQWTPMESDFSEGLSYRIPNLTGGQTCWIILRDFNLAQQHFRIERCPFRRMGVFGVISYTDSIIVDLEPFQNLGNSLDFYYGAKPLPMPDENTIPTLTGQSLNYIPGLGTYVFRNLTFGTEYEFYVRRDCGNGDASCWQGPFSGKTADWCSTIKSVYVDTTTYTWADVTFSFDSNPAGWEVVVCQPGKNPSHEIVGRWVSAVQNDTVTARILRIPLTEPLQLYFKASCAGGGQSWQGPYDLPAGATPPLPVRDIFCGEETYTLPEEEKDRFISYINTTPICGSSDYGERLFLYRANQTDTIAISFAGACGNCDKTAGCGFYYKPASQLPDLKDWKFIGCWKDILPPQTLKFPVEKDSVYYILCNSFAGGSPLTSFSFRISDCNITCPMADSISLESISPTSAVLRWNNAAPGGYYELVYFPVSGARPPISVTTADTMLTLTGLLPASAYTFRIRSFCSPTDPSALRTVTLQLAKHAAVRESFLGRCNPRFLPPGETKPVTYDVFDLIVPESGDYRLTAYTLNTYLYDVPFDPENPALNLLVAVRQAGSGIAYQDTLVALQNGKTYKWVISVSPNYPLDFNHNGYDNIRIQAAGPGQAQIGAAQWKGAQPRPHGKVPLQIAVSGPGAGACRDTSGWVHYYSWGGLPGVENDALLLSLKTDVDPEVLDDLPLAFYNYPPAAMLITNPPAEFVQNPDGFYEMNRFWGMLDLLPAQQIDQDFLIRFYYTQTDYELLKTAIEAAGGKLDSHEAMYFHKINGFHDYSNLAPFYNHIFVPRALAYDAEGYWQYANGPEATPSTWRHGTYNGEHYAEMVIRGFSGGGGGASVNGKSVFDPVSKTTQLGTKRVFILSPNPNTGVFSMEWASPAEPGASLRITDPGGRLWREELVAAGSSRQTVQAGDLPAGLYFLQVLADGKVLAVERFVIQ